MKKTFNLYLFWLSYNEAYRLGIKCVKHKAATLFFLDCFSFCPLKLNFKIVYFSRQICIELILISL